MNIVRLPISCPTTLQPSSGGPDITGAQKAPAHGAEILPWPTPSTIRPATPCPPHAQPARAPSISACQLLDVLSSSTPGIDHRPSVAPPITSRQLSMQLHSSTAKPCHDPSVRFQHFGGGRMQWTRHAGQGYRTATQSDAGLLPAV